MILCPRCGSCLKQLTGTTDFICNDKAHWIPVDYTPVMAQPKDTRGFTPNGEIAAAIRAEILAVWDKAYTLKKDGLSYANVVKALNLPFSAVTFGKHFRAICEYKGEVIKPKVGRYAVTGKPHKRTRSDGRPFGAGAAIRHT